MIFYIRLMSHHSLVWSTFLGNKLCLNQSELLIVCSNVQCSHNNCDSMLEWLASNLKQRSSNKTPLIQRLMTIIWSKVRDCTKQLWSLTSLANSLNQMPMYKELWSEWYFDRNLKQCPVQKGVYCKSLKFSVPLYLASLAFFLHKR